VGGGGGGGGEGVRRFAEAGQTEGEHHVACLRLHNAEPCHRPHSARLGNGCGRRGLKLEEVLWLGPVSLGSGALEETAQVGGEGVEADLEVLRSLQARKVCLANCQRINAGRRERGKGSERGGGGMGVAMDPGGW